MTRDDDRDVLAAIVALIEGDARTLAGMRADARAGQLTAESATLLDVLDAAQAVLGTHGQQHRHG
jgi:hypothetical protein